MRRASMQSRPSWQRRSLPTCGNGGSGATSEPTTGFPGPFAPVTLEEALDTREIWLLVADQEESHFDRNGADEPRFLPEIMPIAMSPGGDDLIVNLRVGEHHGAVFLWDHERWGLGTPLWDSVGSMLEDIGVALESRTPVLHRHTAPGGAEAACVGKISDSGDQINDSADHQARAVAGRTPQNPGPRPPIYRSGAGPSARDTPIPAARPGPAAPAGPAPRIC
ncbi:SMI1/KNR4 family protein [Kitasatospora sp. NPDC056181]|uniref:SMI1/KNR4 family protein n=1 Tax=Kitasatospora sp. NPDC056181 TaxID=3345737 RepID=UPI0035DBAA5A